MGKRWSCLDFHWGPHWILQPDGQQLIYSCHCDLVTVNVHFALLQNDYAISMAVENLVLLPILNGTSSLKQK